MLLARHASTSITPPAYISGSLHQIKEIAPCASLYFEVEDFISVTLAGTADQFLSSCHDRFGKGNGLCPNAFLSFFMLRRSSKTLQPQVSLPSQQQVVSSWPLSSFYSDHATDLLPLIQNLFLSWIAGYCYQVHASLRITTP